MNFWLGTHQPQWLATARVPLFVSWTRLRGRRTFPRAAAPWCQDSGGFTMVSKHGFYPVAAADYAADTVRHQQEIGMLEWASPQDWMCEPFVIAKTGLTIEEHQRRTIDSYFELTSIAPSVRWTPVLQGWTSGDYFRHAEQYARRGIDLTALPVVGLGSVCRRQHTMMASLLISRLKHDGLRIHAFGFKKLGLLASHRDLESADSMAWSFSARREPPLPGHGARHKNCANCEEFALGWRSDLLEAVDRQPQQLRLEVA